MIFPLEHLQAMERKYPGVLDQTAIHPYDWLVFWNSRGVDTIHHDGLRSLFYWEQFKVVYSFDESISNEILDSSRELDDDIPVSAMRHLPFPCIAIQTVPFSVNISGLPFSFNGNGYIWFIDNSLFVTWQLLDSGIRKFGDYQFTYASVELKDDLTFYDCFDQAVLDNLSRTFKADEVDRIKQVYKGKPFSRTVFTDDINKALKDSFGEKRLSDISCALNRASLQVVLLEVAIAFILYLNCTNADIEDAEEKLKTGSWSSLLGGKPNDYVSHKMRRNALRDGQNIQAFDAGYRVASKFNRSFSGGSFSDNNNNEGSTISNSENSTGTSRGYSKRRAHYHHYWIGPRDGIVADDIMHPGPGERGLVLKWVEATEIHPELRDDQAIVVPVSD